jgi:hypothetical protein
MRKKYVTMIRPIMLLPANVNKTTFSCKVTILKNCSMLFFFPENRAAEKIRSHGISSYNPVGHKKTKPVTQVLFGWQY